MSIIIHWKILLIIHFISLAKSSSSSLCPNKTNRLGLSLMDFNRDFDPIIYKDLHQKTIIKTNFLKKSEVASNLSSKKSKTKYFQPVISIINTTNDAYIQFTYSNIMLEREEENDDEINYQNQKFALYMNLTHITYLNWSNRKDLKKMNQSLEAYLNIKQYISKNRNTELVEYSNEGKKYYQVKFYLEIPYKKYLELDEAVINLIKLIKNSLNDIDLNCNQKIIIDDVKLSNYHDEINEHGGYNYNFTQNIESFLSNKLFFYTNIDNQSQIYRLNSYKNENKYVLEFNSARFEQVVLFLNLDQEEAISITDKIECNSDLYLFNINHLEDSIQPHILNNLLRNFTTQIINSTKYLICLNDSEREIHELSDEYDSILKEKKNQQFYKLIYMIDQYLSFIFSTVSCILIPVLFLFYLKLKKETFKTLFKENSLIYILLSSLFLAHLITIMNIIFNKYLENSNLCISFALLKQFIWLTSIFQMSTYAIDLYFKIVQPFSIYSKKPPFNFYISYFLTLPLVLTAIPFLLWINLNETIYSFHHCFLTGTNYLLTCFFLPICLVWIINTILMIIYYKRLKETSSVKSRTMSEAKKNNQLLKTFIKLSKSF
jgi:hypothetical protein